MKYEVVYQCLLKECKKQILKGNLEGVTATEIASILDMKRPNVVREFKKLIEFNMVTKKEGKPTYYFVNIENLSYDIANEDNFHMIYNLDKYFKTKSKELAEKGYSEREIRAKLLEEINTYMNKYFRTLRREVTRVNIKKIDVKYIIGVEGGGIKTEAIAYDLDGNEVSRGNSDFGSVLIKFDDALKNTEMAIVECMRKLEEKNCIYIYIGLSGSEIGKNYEKIKEFFEEKFNAPIKVVDDKDIVVSSMLFGEDGIAIYSRVGSICYGVKNNKRIRIGGWGHLLGDEGSGYRIVIDAFRDMMMSKDTGNRRSNLSKSLLNAIGASDEYEALDFIYSKNKGEVYELLKIIKRESERDDDEAIRILKKAGSDLAEVVIRAYKRLRFEGEVRIAIKGVVITEIYYVKNSFIKKLKSEGIEFKIHICNAPLAKGAYYKVLKELSLDKSIE